MKPLHFTVPVQPDQSIMVQEDILPQFYPHLHRHKEAQIIWIVKGEGSLVVETNIYSFQPDDLFMIAPNQAHILKSEESEGGVHSLSVFFDPFHRMATLFQMPELKEINSFLDKAKSGLKVSKDDSGLLTQQIKKIKNLKSTELLIGFLILLNLLRKSKATFISETTGSPLSEGHRMEKIYDFILKNYKDDLTLEEISEVASMTPHAFCRYFKKHSGITFVTFLNQLRISEAQRSLLDNKFETITEIAYDSGFNSLTNFNRVFKKVVGLAPKDYLLEYKKRLG